MEKRLEKKFVTHELNEKEIEYHIKNNPFLFSEIFYKRQVNNIYFDSIDFKNYYDNVDGNTLRVKIRIRWYGKVFGEIKNPVLELKFKNNELSWKSSFKIEGFVLDEKFSSENLKKIFSKSDFPEELKEKLKSYFPSLLNSYQRKYFLSKDKKYRITLDSDLKFFRINKEENLFLEKLDEDGKKVLELKYSYRDFKRAEILAQYLPFRLIANSKYTKGIDLINGS